MTHTTQRDILLFPYIAALRTFRRTYAGLCVNLIGAVCARLYVSNPSSGGKQGACFLPFTYRRAWELRRIGSTREEPGAPKGCRLQTKGIPLLLVDEDAPPILFSASQSLDNLVLSRPVYAETDVATSASNEDSTGDTGPRVAAVGPGRVKTFSDRLAMAERLTKMVSAG